jgi:hypothetical protein
VSHVVVDDILEEHARHPHALFQAASQFNCLEMIDSSTTPEHGVSRYAYDNTQGPACSIACAAGTVVRNYFVDVAVLAHPSRGLVRSSDGFLGQRADRQINNLDGVEALLLELLQLQPVHPSVHSHQRQQQPPQYAPWALQNGYVVVPFPPVDLLAANTFIFAHRHALMDALKIGIQADTEVTQPAAAGVSVGSGPSTEIYSYPQETEAAAACTGRQSAQERRSDATTTVTQAYCAAIPMPDLTQQDAGADATWSALAPLASLVLQVRSVNSGPRGLESVTCSRFYEYVANAPVCKLSWLCIDATLPTCMSVLP